jgi:hypothetical protein
MERANGCLPFATALVQRAGVGDFGRGDVDDVAGGRGRAADGGGANAGGDGVTRFAEEAAGEKHDENRDRGHGHGENAADDRDEHREGGEEHLHDAHDGKTPQGEKSYVGFSGVVGGLAEAKFGGGGEVGGDGLRDLAGGGPFGAALKRGDEGDAAHGGGIGADVAERGVEDAAGAEGDGEENGFVAAGRCGRDGLVVGGGEDGEVFGGAAEAVVEFVGGVTEGRRKAAGDGVVGFADVDCEGVDGAVVAAATGRGIADDFIVPIDPRAPAFVATFPAAEAADGVVVGPVGKGVAGGVNDDEAAALADVVDEGGFRFGGPGVAGVVGDDDGVAGEVGAEGGHVAAFGRRDGDVDGEETGVGERFFEEGRGEFPVVVVLPGEDEGFQRGGGGGEWREEEDEEGGEESEHRRAGFRRPDARRR